MKSFVFKNKLDFYDKASALVDRAHRNQKDKAGKRYLDHLYTVAMYVAKTFGPNDKELLAIAVLHDVLEDTDVTYDLLRSIGMSERIIDGVKSLTRLPGMDRICYENQVIGNIDAVKVKLWDLYHNMDLSRLNKITRADIKRNQYYLHFYLKLLNVIEYQYFSVKLDETDGSVCTMGYPYEL